MADQSPPDQQIFVPAKNPFEDHQQKGREGPPGDGGAAIQLNPGFKTNDQAKMKRWFRNVEAALSSKSLWEWLVVGASPGLGMGIEIHKRVNPASAASQHGQHAQPLVPADKGKAP
jgi:hypothetical protein